jgi:hypothetical protein
MEQPAELRRINGFCKKSDTTGFSRVVVQFEANSGLVLPNQDTTDSSRVEVQLLPFSSQGRPEVEPPRD